MILNIMKPIISVKIRNKDVGSQNWLVDYCPRNTVTYKNFQYY